jgi:hypothetical protein
MKILKKSKKAPKIYEEITKIDNIGEKLIVL